MGKHSVFPVTSTCSSWLNLSVSFFSNLGPHRFNRSLKGMATHSSILACRIPWTEEPGGLQSIGSQRVD